MSWKNIATVAACALLATPALAQPSLSVDFGGEDGGNLLWNVMASPDESLFSMSCDTCDPANTLGGSLAFELGFEAAGGDILDITTNTTNIEQDANTGEAIWGWETIADDFPEGIQIGTGGDASQAFAAVGGTFFTDAGPFEILTITTAGSVTELAYGGRFNADGTLGDVGTLNTGRLAQDGTNFHDFSGVVMPVPPGDAGDFNGDGAVDGSDLQLLSGNWGAEVPPVPDGWTGFQPTSPAIDGDELQALSGNWGAGGGSGAVAAAAVPEPSSLVLGGLALIAIGLLRRREG